MKTIQIKKPLRVIHGVLTPLNNNFHSRIEADCEGVSIVISGMRDVVDRMLAPDATPSDPHSLIQRALSALGYVVGDHQKDVAQFSRWVDHLTAFPRTDEAKAIWTEAMLRLFGSDSPPLVPSTIAEASGACGAFVVEQMRLFPPTMKTSAGDRPGFVIIGPLVESERTELQEWRTIAKDFGWDSPSGMRGVSEQIRQWQDISDKATFQIREWETSAKQRGWSTPLDLRGRTAADDAELAAWRDAAKANDFASPAEFASIKDWSFGQYVDRKVNRDWQLATACESPKDAEDLRSAWHSETNCMFPKEAGDKIRTLKSALKLQESRGDEFVRDVRAWKKATGATDPANAVNVIAEQRDAVRLEWQEATGAMNPTAASKHIHDMKAQLLSYASEIDALRKVAQSSANGPTVVNIEHGASVTLNGQTIGHVHNPGRDLAKVRAELDSKRRECATEKERADKAEQNTRAVAVIIDQVRNALGIVGADDSDLPQHVADLKRVAAATEKSTHVYQLLESAISEARKAAGIDYEKVGSGSYTSLAQWCGAAREKLSNAIIPLPKPDKVKAGQRWAIASTVGYVYGSITGDHPVDLPNLGTVQEKQLLTSESWTFLGS